jgi:8-oxo-dGTP pyrophosphatase MutT (NUDIX family)
MTIWIDQPIWPRHGTVFAHLISDTSLDELHAFAVRVGLHPRSFEGDHYDVPQERYAAVLAAGATSTTGADVVRRLIASGLRLRKRRGDRPVARIPAMVFPDGTRASVDLVVSDRPVTAGGVFAAMCFVQDAAGRFAVVHSPRRDAWGSPGGWRDAEESASAAAVREVREETGLVVSADDLEVCAYERFTVDGEVRGRWLPGRSYLQVYRTRLPGTGPAMAATADDVDGWRWVDRSEFERLCGGDFWWPLVPRLFG